MKPIVAIFAAPSGSGKSTIARAIALDPRFAFSISATTRAPRGAEQHGVDYYFMSVDEFRALIEAGAFVEYEEVYPGKYYGTTKAEVDSILGAGKSIVFDVDVKGGINLKKYFGERAVNFFIKVPSMEILKERLMARGTETPEDLAMRIAKAEEETLHASEFDHVIINDDLERAIGEVKGIVAEKVQG